MRIQIFRAASLQAALEEIRREMGPDASVLRTRQLRDGWMGWLGRTYVEVTAGINERGERTEPRGDTTLELRHCETSSISGATIISGSGRISGAGQGGLNETANQNTTQSNQVNSNVTGSPIIPGEIDLPPQLIGYRRELRTAGVDESIVTRWIKSTLSFAANLGEEFCEPWLEHLQRSVAREIRLSGPIQIQPGDRQVVALVGPTGVGKTTTVAKLAAGFRLESKRRVGLLTIDTFRIAAVQQLRAYAEIMDLPMEVVEQPDQMRPALRQLGDVDLVLIDTAGRSPRSDSRIEQLVELLRLAEVDETHLVISATSSADSIGAVLTGFSATRPTSTILTKLDETSHTAAILSAITASATRPGMPISYTTNGQQVPDDIAIADVTKLVSRLLPANISVHELGAA